MESGDDRTGGMMLRTLLIVVTVVVGLCLFWGVHYVGRQWGWPDSISTAVGTGIALSVLFVEKARIRRAADRSTAESSAGLSITRAD
jgi:hypothetical protein